MKALNISGTISEFFSIGAGLNKTELRVIEGELYFRNAGTPLKKVLGSSASIILSPLEWNPNTQYLKGNLFYKDSGLWSVQQDFISNEDFLSQGFAYKRIIDFNGQSIINIDLLNNFSLNILHSNLLIVTGQNLGESIIKLPLKTSLILGSKYTIYNTSSSVVKIYDFNSNFLNTILPNYKYTFLYNGLSGTGWSIEMNESNSIELLGIEKNIAFLNPGDSVPLFGASGVFATNHSCNIKFFESDNPSINGEIFYTSGTDSFIINSFSKLIVKDNMENKICFFNNNDALYLKNNTTQSKMIIFHKNF